VCSAKYELPVCPTKYELPVSNKIWQLPVCPIKYIGTCQCVQQNIWRCQCVEQNIRRCQCVQQNMTVAGVSNKLYWQSPMWPTKYESCQCVQNMTVASVSNKIYDSYHCVQQNTPHCVDSVQQNTPDSEQSPVSNKIYLRQWTVSNKMWEQVIDDRHRPWQTRCKVLCQPTSLTDGHGFYDYVLMSPVPGTVAATVNF
jgi:hypothetical protein